MNARKLSTGGFFVAVLAAVVTFSVAATLRAQADITGFWVFRVPTGDGNFRETFFDLKQDGRAVAGRSVGTRVRLISGGTFQNGALHFTVDVGNPPQSRVVTYDGTWDSGKFTLTSQFPGRDPVHGTLERSTPQAAQPPARIEPPALHDVRDNGLVRTPPMGWNSWNKFAGKVDDATVRAIADAMASNGMKAAGYTYINIDDTWEGQRDAQGNITTNLKFPNMKALADYVHSKGLKIGIYSSPGPKTCAGYEGSYGHEMQDANTYAAWGIDYLKYDWCSASRIYKDDEMQAVYQKMGDALVATGRPIVFSLCQYGKQDVWMWGAKVGGNLWRTTDDISDSWQSMSNIGFHQFYIQKYIRVGHWNDPDMLEIGNGHMTAEEYRTHMSMWSLLAAPLLAGNDLRDMTEETKAILENPDVIAIDQDPAGHPAQQLSSPESPEVVVMRPLADGSYAVGLFNRGEQAGNVTVNWRDAGLEGKLLRGRDLWAHRDVALDGASYTAQVPSHGVALLRVSAR